MKYSFGTVVAADSFGRVVDVVTDALKAEGFGVLTEIDVAATLKEKLGVDHPPYRILGACNPPLAHQALVAEPDIGLLLPCNVVVREQNAGSYEVLFADPKAMFHMVDNAELAPMADAVEERLQRVCAALGG